MKTTSNLSAAYLILMRHGPKIAPASDEKQSSPIELRLDQELSLAKNGALVHELAAKLAEHISLKIEAEPIVIGEILHGTHTAVQETKSILKDHLELYQLGDIPATSLEDLDPKEFWPAAGRLANADRLCNQLLQRLQALQQAPTGPGQANTILVVGHQPQLGWIAEKVLRKPQPIDRAEIVCIALKEHWLGRFRPDRWLLWTISASDKEVEQALREKIESKKKLAEILGGLMTFFLGFLLQTWLDTDKIARNGRTALAFSIVFFFTGLLLYLASMYSYDRLLMPVRFWSEVSKPLGHRWLVHRPPSSAAWILYQNMTRVWNWMFTPATISVLLGLLLLAIGVFQPGLPASVMLFAGLVILLIMYRRFRPTLGTED